MAQAGWRLGLILKTTRSQWKVLERSCKHSTGEGVKLEERDQLKVDLSQQAGSVPERRG